MTSRQRGDTIIEVMIATAIASLTIMSILALMNRNLATIQLAVESTIVRQNIDSQSEILRFLKDEYLANRSSESGYSAIWQDITDVKNRDNIMIEATPFGECNPREPTKAFYFTQSGSGDEDVDISSISMRRVSSGFKDANGINGTDGDPFEDVQAFARPGEGLWIEPVISEDQSTRQTRYVDFHVRACWYPPYSGPTSTMGTIIRLYYTAGDDTV